MEPILVKDTNKKSYEIHLKNGFEYITALLENIAPKASKTSLTGTNALSLKIIGSRGRLVSSFPFTHRE